MLTPLVTRACIALVAATAIASGSGCATTSDMHEAERSAVFAQSPGAALEIETENGAIRVERGEAPQIEITASVRATTQERLDATRVAVDYGQGDTIRVAIEWADGKRLKQESCSLLIRTPAVDGVDARTSNGRIEVSGMAGEAILRTSNGRITVQDHKGSVNARTSNGRLTIQHVKGPIDVETSNGRVTIVGVEGPIEAKTTNGRITATLASDGVGIVRCETGNGSITAPMPEHGQVIESRKGLLVAQLGEGPGATLETSNGAITLKFESSRSPK